MEYILIMANIPQEYLSKSQKAEIEISEQELQKKNPLYCECCQRDKIFIATIFDNRTRKERKTEFQSRLNNGIKVKRKQVA